MGVGGAPAAEILRSVHVANGDGRAVASLVMPSRSIRSLSRRDSPASAGEHRPPVRDAPVQAVLALQRTAGNHAVARLLAPERMVARFEAGEHAQMGGERTITITAGDGGAVELTEGELIALGDFYVTPQDMLTCSPRRPSSC
jgi:hypothetical protein